MHKHTLCDTRTYLVEFLVLANQLGQGELFIAHGTGKLGLLVRLLVAQKISQHRKWSLTHLGKHRANQTAHISAKMAKLSKTETMFSTTRACHCCLQWSLSSLSLIVVH